MQRGIGVDDGIFLAIIWRMPRPKKDPSLKKGETLRIPVSEDEKRRLYDAATATDGEFAGWARTILLKAADNYAASRETAKNGAAPKDGGRKTKENARAASLS